MSSLSVADAAFAIWADEAMASGFVPGSEVWAVPKPLISDKQKTRTAICAINFFSTGLMGSSSSCEPQGLKAPDLRIFYGAAEAVAFHDPALGVNAALADRVGHSVDREHVGRDTIEWP